jgi:aspartyl-tRNA(Asn)/glutamyl-tRNA(Gln) amidotransferase subunit B
MEKGHLRCDANIDVKDENGKMSPIVEIKNLNSFRFVDKALQFEEKRLQEEYNTWPEQKTKITRGFDSTKGITFEQRVKEEASDYRYFPEPDLPPIDTAKFDLDSLKADVSESEEEKISKLVAEGVAESDANVLVQNMTKYDIYTIFSKFDTPQNYIAKIIVHNYFGFELNNEDMKKVMEYSGAIKLLYENKVNKNRFQQICQEIKSGKNLADINIEKKVDLEKIINEVIANNQKEVERYKNGDKKLLRFFVGQVMKESEGRADPKETGNIINHMLES